MDNVSIYAKISSFSSQTRSRKAVRSILYGFLIAFSFLFSFCIWTNTLSSYSESPLLSPIAWETSLCHSLLLRSHFIVSHIHFMHQIIRRIVHGVLRAQILTSDYSCCVRLVAATFVSSCLLTSLVASVQRGCGACPEIHMHTHKYLCA